MPWDVFISEYFDTTFVRWRGKIGLSEFRDYVADHLSHPLYRAGRPGFTDFSGLTEVNIDFSVASLMVREINQRFSAPGIVRSSVIYAPNDVTFGISRMLEQLSEPQNSVQIMVFNNQRAALSAAGLPMSTLQELYEHIGFTD